jgi:hypothetical protein
VSDRFNEDKDRQLTGKSDLEDDNEGSEKSGSHRDGQNTIETAFTHVQQQREKKPLQTCHSQTKTHYYFLKK